MTSRRDFFKLGGAVAAASVSAASINSAAMAALPEIVSMDKPDTQPPLMPPSGRPYNPVVTLNGWTLPWRMKRRGEGIPPGRRAGGARDRARHEGAPVGLQRPVPRPHHRGGGRRPGAPLRHQPAARAHHHPLARPAPAQRHGRRRRAHPAADPAGARPLSTNSSRAAPAPSCTTRTPTKWRRWRWA